MITETQENSQSLNIRLVDRQKEIKLKFLQDQNFNLREQIRDLEENLRLNKEFLTLLIKTDPFLQNGSKEANTQKNLNTNDESNDSSRLLGNLYKIIEKLTKENFNHLENINKLIIERNKAQTKVILKSNKKISLYLKAFINELIADETQKNENEMISELRDRILFLQKLVNQKDRMDDSKTEKKTEDVIICKTLIGNPNEQMMRLFSDLQATKNALSQIYRKYNRLKIEQQDLMKLNYVQYDNFY